MPRTLWTLPLEAAPRGLALAREAGRLLVWTESHWLFWTNRKGERQAQAHFPGPLLAAAADDGSAFAAATDDGRLLWLAPDLQTRWEKRLKGRPTALALDPLGLVAAVATGRGHLEFFHADGEPAREAACPRPARHLAFVPGTAMLLAAADLGWLSAFDLGRGEWRWRDAPVATIGGLAVAGIGAPVLLACSDGLRAYDGGGKPWLSPAPAGPCQSVVVSYEGDLVITAGFDGTLTGLGRDLKPRFTHHPGAAPAALALSAAGDTLYFAQANCVAALALNGV
jgi:hypothetical protein